VEKTANKTPRNIHTCMAFIYAFRPTHTHMPVPWWGPSRAWICIAYGGQLGGEAICCLHSNFHWVSCHPASSSFSLHSYHIRYQSTSFLASYPCIFILFLYPFNSYNICAPPLPPLKQQPLPLSSS
jgi:hypothetical protein